MASALTVLLLGCWLAGHNRVWGEPSYPKPNITLSPSRGVSLGGVVTVWCRGQLRGMRFVLNKEGRHFPSVDSAGFEVVFRISNVSREDGGSYSCSYHSRSEPFTVSYPSDPVELVVRDPSLPRPSISLSPTGVTAPGADVTIRCQGQRRNVTFFLHKAGDLNPQRHMDPAGDGAEFLIPTVGHQHGGSYSCSYRPQSEPFVSSEPSNPVQLVVAEPSYPKPNIYLRPGGGVSLGGAVTVWCRGQHRGVRFVLNKEGRHFPSVDSDGFEVVFPISNVSREDGGSYSCSYHSGSEPFAVSYPSNPVKVLVRGGTDLGHPGAAPAPTHPPGSPGPGGSESPASLGLTSSIITRASAAAAGFLLLLVAFVCFRKTRARKGAAPRPSSTSPLRVLKTPTMQDPVYTSMDEGKETQTLEPDPGADGLTYAELDHQVLQAKWGGPAPAPEPAQPSVYAAINEPDPDGLTYAELDGQALQAKWGGPTPAPAPEPAQHSVYAVINVSQGTPQ